MRDAIILFGVLTQYSYSTTPYEKSIQKRRCLDSLIVQGYYLLKKKGVFKSRERNRQHF